MSQEIAKIESAPVSGDIKLVEAAMLDGGTLRIVLTIKGLQFKRLDDFYHPPVWCDQRAGASLFGKIVNDKDISEDLESIFKAWLIDGGNEEVKQQSGVHLIEIKTIRNANKRLDKETFPGSGNNDSRNRTSYEKG